MQTELTRHLQKVNDNINHIKNLKETLISQQEAMLYKPLIEQAEKVKEAIETSANAKYKPELDELYAQRSELITQVEAERIANAKENLLWYPDNTTVYLWEMDGSRWSSNRQYVRTGKIGIVKVYDGTQTLSALGSSKPDKGDVIVIHFKKDGSIGLKFDIITRYGSLQNWRPKWLADGDTPQDNIETRKENAEEQLTNAD